MSDLLHVTADAVLLDIEGTISSIEFVRNVLFAYSRQRLPDFVAAHRGDPAIAAILKEAAALADGGDPVAALQRWQERDEKAPPLKKLQGHIWDHGYRSGAFRSSLFPDALAALHRWKAAGLPLYIYSSGSVQAQALFFEFNDAGDLRPLFSGFFDTDIGAKTASASYDRIARTIGMEAPRIIFLSDNVAELTAARAIAMQTVHVIKESAATGEPFPTTRDFAMLDITRGS